MSKLKRLLGALSLVALFIFSSCVDDEVAPEVAALRQAQVDLLNADVAYQNALTAYQNAETAYQEAKTAGQLITNAQAQASLDDQLATLATTVAEQATLQAIEAKKLAEAEQALAVYLASQGLEEAASYLAMWNAVYFGAPAPAVAPAMAFDGHIPDGGIVGLSAEIAALEAGIARDELFLNEDDSVTQAYIDAAVAADLALAEAELADRIADLATKQAELAALEANSPDDAVAVLEQELIDLEDEKDAAAAAVAAAQAVLNDAIDGPKVGFQATVDDFIAADTLPTNINLGDRVNYRTAKANVATDSMELADAVSDTAVWWNYADSLQGIYDAYYTPYISAYEAEIEAAEQEVDDAKTAEDAAGGANSFENDLLDAYNQYVVLYRRINEQANAGVAVRQDTLDMVAARAAWDGLTIADLFTGGSGGTWNDAELTAKFTTRIPSDQYGGGTLDVAGTQGVGGVWADYLNEEDPVTGPTPTQLRQQAEYRLSILEDQYGAAVTEFRNLETYIAEVKAGTNTDGSYDPAGIPVAPIFATGLASYTDLIDDIEAMTQKELFDKLSKAPAPSDNINAAPVAGAKYANAKLAWAAVTTYTNALNGTTTTAGSLSNLTYAISIQGQEAVDAYEAALAELAKTTQAEYDAQGTAIAAAAVALDAAEGAKAIVDGRAAKIQMEIAALYAVLEVAYIDCTTCAGDQVVMYDQFLELVDALKDDIADLQETDRESTDPDPDYTASIQWAEDDVERATVQVTLAAQDGIEVENMIEAKKAEVALKQTQLSVLESFAAEIQALLEAALAG